MRYSLPREDCYGPHKFWDYAQGETLLEAVESARVMSVYQSDSTGMFVLEEGCDNYFRICLTPEQLYQLGREIQEMALSAYNKEEIK